MASSSAVRLALPGGGVLAFDGPAAERELLAGLTPHFDPQAPPTIAVRFRFGEPQRAAGPELESDGDVILLARIRADGALLALHDRRRRLTPAPRAFLEATPGGERYTVHVAEPDAYHRKLGRWLLVGLLAARGAVRFAHASAVAGWPVPGWDPVVTGGAAALILGGHGAGKSSLAAAAVWAGLALLGEGVVLVAADGRALPFFMDGEPVLRLGKRAWRRVRAAHGPGVASQIYPAPAGGVEAKRVVRAGELGRAVAVAPVPLVVAWLPAVGGVAEPGLRIEALTRAAALAEAAPHLEDDRIRALRRFLPPPLDAAAHVARRWHADFPPAAFRVSGSFGFARLAGCLAAGELGLRP